MSVGLPGRDAMIAAWRCLEAMIECEDDDTREALWKAAKRYAEKARAERAGGRPLPARAHHVQTGWARLDVNG